MHQTWQRLAQGFRKEKCEKAGESGQGGEHCHWKPWKSSEQPQAVEKFDWAILTTTWSPGHIGRQDGPNPATHGTQAHTSVSDPAGQEHEVQQTLSSLHLPRWKELAGVQVCGAKSCGGAKLSKQVKDCPKSRHRGCETCVMICTSLSDNELDYAMHGGQSAHNFFFEYLG